MSRIGNKHIDIPAGVEVKVEGNDNKVQYQSMTKKVKIQIIKK